MTETIEMDLREMELDEWEPAPDGGEVRIIVQADVETGPDDYEGADQFEHVGITVEYRIGNLPVGWASLWGIGVEPHLSGMEVRAQLNEIAWELFCEARQHCVDQALLGESASYSGGGVYFPGQACP